MAEELQSLLDRIQKEGVEKARAEADAILAAARAQAAELLKDAERQAQAALDRARQEGEVFAARGRKAVEQAARDAVLAVQEALQAAFRRLVEREVTQTLSAETLKQMLVKMVETYGRAEAAQGKVTVLLEPEQQKTIFQYLAARFAEELRSGLEIKADPELSSGFVVRFAERRLEHNFTPEAITDALCRFLRPQLAELVRGAVKPSASSDAP